MDIPTKHLVTTQKPGAYDKTPELFFEEQVIWRNLTLSAKNNHKPQNLADYYIFKYDLSLKILY